jgi:hypothetical protein
MTCFPSVNARPSVRAGSVSFRPWSDSDHGIGRLIAVGVEPNHYPLVTPKWRSRWSVLKSTVKAWFSESRRLICHRQPHRLVQALQQTGDLMGTVAHAGQVTLVTSTGLNQMTVTEQRKTQAELQSGKTMVEQAFQQYFPDYVPPPDTNTNTNTKGGVRPVPVPVRCSPSRRTFKRTARRTSDSRRPARFRSFTCPRPAIRRRRIPAYPDNRWRSTDVSRHRHVPTATAVPPVAGIGVDMPPAITGASLTAAIVKVRVSAIDVGPD